MRRLKRISGEDCIRILCNKFGFVIIRTRGSHTILRKETLDGVIGTVVPRHKELKIGTLKGILELGKINEDEFSEYL